MESVIKSSLAIVCIITLIIMLVLMSGCQPSYKSPSENCLPESPEDMLTKVVYRTNWLVTVSIIGVAASFFSFLNGSKYGIAGMASCSVALFLALGTLRYAKYFAIFGCVGSFLLVAASILLKSKAVKQLVTSVELMKHKGFDKDVCDTVQDRDTKKLVDKHQKKLKRRK